MAAYAAAVSLMHILDLIENHPSPPISLDRKQVDSLTDVVTFLQGFLEGYVSPFSFSDEADPLEMRIADAAYAAEDVIESYLVDIIHIAAQSTTLDDDVMESYTLHSIQQVAAAAHHEDKQIRYINFYQALQKVIEAMYLIKKEAMETVREKGGLLEAEVQRNVSVEAGSKSSSIETKIEMVGFEDEVLQLKERLVRGKPNREIIPIVGMGGIGKTTLARNVFADKLIKEHFDICLWATISQDYNIEQTLCQVLSRERGNSSVGELGEELHKYLYGRRYLVVLDDMWSIEVWDKMRFFFPDCGERSRVIVTTRISNLAAHLANPSNSLCMSFLNEFDSWTLFSKTVFGSEEGVAELREIGEKIVGKCKGLPLSIAVIGGLLAKSERTREYWEYIEENLSSIVNLENEEYCLRVLKLSYNHLPVYLKPCFLYMGVFDEDSEIRVSTIIQLWVSEGFVKPKKKKDLETVATEYFQELVDRNLLLAHDGAESGCRVHDLVRDLSLREARKQRFYHVYSSREHNNSWSSHPHRRNVVPNKTLADVSRPQIMLEASPVPRSYVCHDHCVKIFLNFRLLRTLHTNTRGYGGSHAYSQKDVFRLVNARLLAVSVDKDEWLDSSMSRLWSLHTLIVSSKQYADLEGPVEFWEMHQLKHVEFTKGRLRLRLPPPPPPNNVNNIVVIMENLHTLIGMKDFHLNEDVVSRIPNLRILDVAYEEKMNPKEHCLSHLRRLSKLESFCCFIKEESAEAICFPHSLNQIHLKSYSVLDDVLTKIGRLPLVEELVIDGGFFRGSKWETVEGQFPRLKKLEMLECDLLEKWIVMDASHFPLLQKIILVGFIKLEEVPLEIAEIATLETLELIFCSESAVLSAKKIVEEQEDSYGEEELSFRVRVEVDDKALFESLESTPNFQVKLQEY